MLNIYSKVQGNESIHTRLRCFKKHSKILTPFRKILKRIYPISTDAVRLSMHVKKPRCPKTLMIQMFILGRKKNSLFYIKCSTL